MRLELENYKTKEREIIDTKEEAIINLSKISVELYYGCGLSLLMDEAVFVDYYLKKGYKIFRLPISIKNPAERYIKINFEECLNLNINSCLNFGTPDFLIVNFDKKEYFFLEVKKEDYNKTKNGQNSLHHHQLNWF